MDCLGRESILCPIFFNKMYSFIVYSFFFTLDSNSEWSYYAFATVLCYERLQVS